MKSALLILISIFAYTALGCRPVFRMYESRGWGEDYIENAAELVAVNDVWDIAEYGLRHSDMRTCPTGVWVGFEYAGYAGGSNIVNGKWNSAVQCRYENDGRYFKSLKVIGNPNDYYASAVTTFLSRSLEFTAFTHLNDTESIRNPRFNSLVLMGNHEMELFTEENYNGTSFCVGPNNGDIYRKEDYDGRNHLRNGTELYTSLNDLQAFIGAAEFRSLRFGCGENLQ